MFSKLLSSILRGHWAIDPRFAESQMPIIARLIKGDGSVEFKTLTVNAMEDDGPEREDKSKWPLCLVQTSAGTVQANRYRSFSDAPSGSIALIPIVGPITKYDGACGEPGAQQLASWVKQASAASNISAIIIETDSPGGMVDGTQTLVDAIANSEKRTIAFINDGMAASAGYWIASAADEIYASRATDAIGSIGVFCTLYDFSEYLKKEGIVAHQIYAPQSTDKNADYKEAIKGNYELIQAELKVLANTFIKSVKNSRGDKLNLDAGDPFTGKMFFAPDAVKIGLIDGIKSFDEVVGVAADSSSANNSTKKSSSMFGNKFSTLTAAIGVAADAHTEESVALINLQLEEKGIAGLTIVRDAELQAAQDTIASLKQERDAANASVTSITTDRDAWKTKAEAFGDQPGDVATRVKKEKDAATEGEGWKSDPNASYNVNANKALGLS